MRDCGSFCSKDLAVFNNPPSFFFPNVLVQWILEYYPIARSEQKSLELKSAKSMQMKTVFLMATSVFWEIFLN